jgi:hypothetical protein
MYFFFFFLYLRFTRGNRTTGLSSNNTFFYLPNLSLPRVEVGKLMGHSNHDKHVCRWRTLSLHKPLCSA